MLTDSTGIVQSSQIYLYRVFKGFNTVLKNPGN